MNKQKFLTAFYTQLHADVYNAADDLIRHRGRITLDREDNYRLDVAAGFLKNPAFPNFIYLASMLLKFMAKYPDYAELLDFNPKVSPAFLANLLSISSILMVNPNGKV